MSGRNSKPKNRGPASHPGRLDQFGDKLSDSKGPEPKPENVCGE
ncbi:hypothetical protein [Paenibacillus sp. FJAT-26967]|nr:hypothetical protein [Paenibacillus sp. FJAT-26967]